MTSPTEQPADIVLAPDFYPYNWTGLDRVELDGRHVVCRWVDGVELRAYDLWLRENAVGLSIDRQTRECVIDPADLPVDPPGGSAAVEVALGPTGGLEVQWWDGARSVHHPGWLRHVAEGLHTTEAWLPVRQPWTSADVGGEPPTHVISSPDRLDVPDPTDATVEVWVDDLVRYGLARLRGVGTDLDTVGRVGSAIGALRDTNFGLTWDVKVDVEPNSTANTSHRLAPHTDLPTRETPPGFQLLHCAANTVEGGESTMADGLAVVAHLAEHHPEHHEALSTLRWVFFNRGPTVDHRWSGPVIDRDPRNGQLTLRAFHPVRGFPDMDEGDVPRAYAALRVFSETAADPRFQVRYRFEPGDLVGFDNRRILHGREAYGSVGFRHLRGCYIDHDEVHSYARRTARRRVAGDDLRARAVGATP